MDRLISEQKAIEAINDYSPTIDGYINAIKAIPSAEPSRDMEEIEEVINCDADAETKCKMISNILTAKPHYFEKQESKTRHWDWVQYDSNPNIGNWHCSECRSIVIGCVNKEDKGGIPFYKYCPHCGARMVKEQEREET